jgi:hypothetical protein
MGFELVLWIVTKSIHLEDLLGDFREQFERKLRIHGQEEATLWARSQVLREVVGRVNQTVQLIGCASVALKWLHKCFSRR